MSKMKIVIEHNGVSYEGQVGNVKSTMLGYEDHGILTTFLYVEWPGGGIGVGGYALDEPTDDASGKFLGRVPTGYGFDVVVQTMKTVGVDTWEKIKGKDIVVLFDKNRSGWGSTSVGFASLDGERVFIFRDHVEEWKARV